MKDWLGQEYNVGDKVIYAAGSGRSITMVLAEVVKIRPKDDDKFTVTVQPLGSSRWEQHSGKDHYIDTRTGKEIKNIYSGPVFNDPDIWAKLGGYYDDNGNRLGAKHQSHYELVYKLGLHYESGELQPYIEKRTDKPKPVTLTVTENIVKWTDRESLEIEIRHRDWHDSAWEQGCYLCDIERATGEPA